MSQHVSTLKNYSKQLSDLDTRQQSLLNDLHMARKTLEKDSQEKLNMAIPKITEQSKTMENVEKRVETARTKLAQQVEMVLFPLHYKWGMRVNSSWRILISRLLRIGG